MAQAAEIAGASDSVQGLFIAIADSVVASQTALDFLNYLMEISVGADRQYRPEYLMLAHERASCGGFTGDVSGILFGAIGARRRTHFDNGP